MVTAKRTDPISAPFTILIDGREKAPYRFTGLNGNASQNHRPIIVATEWAHLKTGDYTIRGFESFVAVERKSLEDLFSTLGQHRDRFEEEHKRLAEFQVKAVVIEADRDDVVLFPPERSKLNPKSVKGTEESWFVKYGVPWFYVGSRRSAEEWTFGVLEKAWRRFTEECRNDSSER